MVAAVAILLIIGGLLFLSVQDETGVEKNIKIIAEKNQLYVLPDSTKVWMQPGSSIRYAKAFMQDRRVWLEGNSLFEVQTQIDNIANISWENGRYNFKDVPLAQLIQIVSRMYHTDILMEGVNRDEVSFSGSIHYNESLDNVLNKIRFSLNLNIRKVDDRFILY